ncbi:MAG: glycosyltransferase family protein [Lachnospiraceae bacterium]|nr:glycosyltransferase family protein [Lachnospiraceae bacterium]
MKHIAIIQARTTSSRLPGKVLLPLCEKSIIQNITERISRSALLDEVIIATSSDKSDDVIDQLCRKNNINVFRGSLDNVLERFYLCALKHNADVIIRCTADNPFVDAEIIDNAIKTFKNLDLDYLSYKKQLPLGMSVEVFSFAALKKAYNKATDNECLEHVTPYIVDNPSLFRTLKYNDTAAEDNSKTRLTVDTPEDYELASLLYDYFGSNNFHYPDLMQVLLEHPEWKSINSNVRQKTTQYKGEFNEGRSNEGTF